MARNNNLPPLRAVLCLMLAVLSLVLILTTVTFDGTLNGHDPYIVDVENDNSTARSELRKRQAVDLMTKSKIMPDEHYCCDITSKPTPDPFVTYAHGKFYMTFTANNRIPMWDSTSLLGFHSDPNIGAVWWPPADSPYSKGLWAPELHAVQGRWYIYFAAADPKIGNPSHRSYVLGGPPASQDPHAGPWEFLGPIKDMDQSQWAIDSTVFEFRGAWYYVYSGWDLVEPKESQQKLYILRLADATTAASRPVAISQPEYDFEFSGRAGINEGPQFLASPDASWQGLVYSCAGSWTPRYKMNTLRLVGLDPLVPGSWWKSDEPLLQNNDWDTGPYGPGHGSFVQAGNQTLALFHATDSKGDGNRGRRCRMQRVEWTGTSGGPDMGQVVGVVDNEVAKRFGDGMGAEEEEARRRLVREPAMQGKLLDLAHALTGR